MISFDDIELRVLGVVMEKALAHTSGYPLTVNAVVLGANQKQNRNPVAEYSEADVTRALYGLQTKQVIKHAATSAGARANRFEHNVAERFHWDRREQAVMAELMLRSHQTPGELRSRASRMTPFQDLTAVTVVLEELSRRDPPFVEELPREPGRSANRWRHLLATDAEPALAATSSATIPPEGSASVAPQALPVSPVSALAQSGDDLVDRVARLEARVAELERMTAAQRPQDSDALDGTGESGVS